MMTKEDFISLADHIIGQARGAEAEEVWNSATVYRLAGWLSARYPRFNRNRWLDYIAGKVGPDGGKVKL